jgi:hypothetical protein
VKFSFIAKHRGIWAVDWMCEALGVSRGGFYGARRRGSHLSASIVHASVHEGVKSRSLGVSTGAYGAPIFPPCPR